MTECFSRKTRNKRTCRFKIQRKNTTNKSWFNLFCYRGL